MISHAAHVQAHARCTDTVSCSNRSNRISNRLFRVTPRRRLEELVTCPLTCEIMREPVVAADGFTYERTAIQVRVLDVFVCRHIIHVSMYVFGHISVDSFCDGCSWCGTLQQPSGKASMDARGYV